MALPAAGIDALPDTDVAVPAKAPVDPWTLWSEERAGSAVGAPEVEVPARSVSDSVVSQNYEPPSIQPVQSVSEVEVPQHGLPLRTEQSGSAPETWERFLAPDTLRPWYWNGETNEFFYEDESAASGWKQFFDPDWKKLWWFNESECRYFLIYDVEPG